jgi:hypothetical protein
MKRLLLLTAVAFAVVSFIPPSIVQAAAQVITVLNPSGVREGGSYVDESLKQGMLERKITVPRKANEFPREGKETLKIKKDASTEVSRLFYHRGWTDGLPIVQPTPELVKAMLQGSDLEPDFVIAVIDPMGGQATVEKIAINAVMAGCEPAHMPILIAAIEAITNPDADLRGSATTTSPDAPMIIVSGSMVKDLGINDGANTFGRGNKANASISRAFHLILQNVGGNWPGVTDMSCIGQPGDFVMFMAENTTAAPLWGPLHGTLGVPSGRNAVTVITAEGYHGILGIGQTSERFLELAADKIRSDNWAYRKGILLVIANDTAKQLINDGWTRESIEAFIRGKAVVPLPEFKKYFIGTGADLGRDVPDWVAKETDDKKMVPRPFFDKLLILVAGGVGEKSMVIPLWAKGKAVSREVRLPYNWQDLIKDTEDWPTVEKN